MFLLKEANKHPVVNDDHWTYLKCVGLKRNKVSDNETVGAHHQGIGHLKVAGDISLEILDNDAVSTVRPPQQSGPGHAH